MCDIIGFVLSLLLALLCVVVMFFGMIALMALLNTLEEYIDWL